MPIFRLGPFSFSGLGGQSGSYDPQAIEGPAVDSYVAEHQVPGREGGIVEYLGSRQPSYTIRGFITPRDKSTDNAGVIFSGPGTAIALNAEATKDTLLKLKGSGALLVQIESTYTNVSGYRILYENDFFFIQQLTFGYEAGKGYPYYPYTMVLHRASPKTYGNSSGIATYAPTGTYFSGFIRLMQLRSGAWAVGETINSLGFYAQSVASGNAKMAVYPDIGVGTVAPVAQSLSQPVNSGWNYFPIRPSFITTSGHQYHIAIKSDTTNSLGWQLQTTESNHGVSDPNPQVSGSESFISGSLATPYSADFPTTPAGLLFPNANAWVSVSGNAFKMVMVTA